MSLHVIFRKEDLDRERLEGKVVIVLDVLFATTTIAAALANGATDVVPVVDAEAARTAACGRDPRGYVMAGELNAVTLPGFAHPTPLALLSEAPPDGKTLIYSTTNGTVALAKSAGAAHVYAAALVNARATVEHVLRHHPGLTVLIVCSGSVENFNLEDFYGAGYFVSLFAQRGVTEGATDAALAAQRMHDASPAVDCLNASRVGRMMLARGLDAEVAYAAAKDQLDVVARLDDGRLTAVRSAQA
ncbi:2-phosphosulfolactate phosphatase [Usitatibacter palustris]|uniref:Probable 2-phosphosulfolactate phosphatase n=1 Tax=Usitatibacter palustris TaxID=2732487 RepID=A0A6M4H1Z5_9PROT|nr:2-phosphosulfolactate phosphatase [Usitatibacter palustris]QJR13365.1 putative 2-phosphosulfolactate phosphatase [Usitatibacter palustris]